MEDFPPKCGQKRCAKMAVLNLSVLPKESAAIAAQVAEKRKNRQPLCFEQAAGHLAIINVFPRPYSVVFAFCRTDHRVCLHSRILYVQLKPFWRSLYHPSCARGFRKTNRTVTRVSSAHTTRGRPGLDGSHEMMPTEHLPTQAQFFFKDAYCSGDDTAMPKNLCQ